MTVEQAPHTHAVMLSKPAWSWGAEMGANDMAVCIGYGVVSTRTDDDNDITTLLGIDLVR